MEVKRRYIRFLLWLLMGLFLIAVPAVWILTRKAPPPQSAGLAGVRVGTPMRRDFTESLPFMGRVESAQAVDLVAFTQARVVEVVAQDGAAVKKGQVLFKLGGPTLDPELAATRSRVKSAKRQLALSRAVLSRKAASAETKLVDQNELAVAEAAVANHEAALAASFGRLRTLEEQAVFRAPVSGVFTDRRVNAGQDVAPGTVLAEITSPGALRVASVVYGAHGQPPEGLSALLYAEGKEFAARVTQSFPDQTPAGGTLVWLEGSSLEEALRPGQSVQGRLILRASKQALAVPRGAVVYDEAEKPYVFVANGQSYTKTAVRIGLSDPKWVEILDGLKAGENIVIEGAYSVYYEDFAKTHAVAD